MEQGKTGARKRVGNALNIQDFRQLVDDDGIVHAKAQPGIGINGACNVDTDYVSLFIDQDEAVEVADEIIITNHGKIEQMGTPSQIYKSPDTPFVAQFIGRPSEVHNYDTLNGFDKIEGADKAVIRPEFVKISKFGKLDRYMSAAETGIVEDVVFRGNRLDVTIDVHGIKITGEWSLEKDSLEIGEKVNLLIYRIYVMDDTKAYLCENKEMQEEDVFYI